MVLYKAKISIGRKFAPFDIRSYPWHCCFATAQKEEATMFSNRQVMPAIPVSDLERAKDWYAEKLDLKPAMELEAGAIYQMAGKSAFLLYPTPEAGVSPNTLMAFSSEDVEADVAALKGKGVAFEEIDSPELKTVNAVATIGNVRSAWFRDLDGNILAVSTRPA